MIATTTHRAPAERGLPRPEADQTAAALRRAALARRRHTAVTFCAVTMAHAASILLAGEARAQSHACELLKTELAARFEASGVHGFTLEAVPADTPVPPDAKAIGNCEAGAYKVLYRRWGASRSPAGVASAASVANLASSASTPKPVAPPDKPTTRLSPFAQASRPPPPASAAAPSPDLHSIVRAADTRPVLAPPTPEPAPALAVGAGDVTVVRTTGPAPESAQPAQQDRTVALANPLARRAFDLMVAYWRWIGGLVLLPLAAWILLWRVHRSAYDKDGLPRGPRLKL